MECASLSDSRGLRRNEWPSSSHCRWRALAAPRPKRDFHRRQPMETTPRFGRRLRPLEWLQIADQAPGKKSAPHQERRTSLKEKAKRQSSKHNEDQNPGRHARVVPDCESLNLRRRAAQAPLPFPPPRIRSARDDVFRCLRDLRLAAPLVSCRANS